MLNRESSRKGDLIPWLRRSIQGLGARESYAIAACAFLGAATYLCVVATRYGLDLKVYRDAIAYWESGNDPYAASFTGLKLPFTYPPFALLALSPVSWLDFLQSLYLLWAVSVASAVCAVVLVSGGGLPRISEKGLLLSAGWVCVSVLALEPARSDMDYGQVELILMSLIVCDLMTVPVKCRGILLGIVAAIKLTPLIFLVYLIAAGDMRSAGRAMVTLIGCTLTAFLLWPSESLEFWAHDITEPGRDGTISYAGNQCWYAVIQRMELSGDWTEAAWILISLLTLGIGVFVTRRCMQRNRAPEALTAIALTRPGIGQSRKREPSASLRSIIRAARSASRRV